MLDKFNPLEGATEHITPQTWNPGHVAHRMVEAYRVLRTMPTRIGPMAYGAAWPAVRLEFADLLEESARLYRQQEVTREQIRWSAEDISRADEALAWPVTFLSDYPRRAEAVQLWAWGRANRRSLRAILHARRRRSSERIGSDSSLRRYLQAGLTTLATRLEASRVPVR